MGTVILVHGYFKGSSEMHPLRGHLREFGWNVLVTELPATFGSLDRCRYSLSRFIAAAARAEGTVHLVGHSFGGLVIRSYLAENNAGSIGRCVLIGTPNRGSRLADIGRRFARPLFRVLKPLNALVSDAPAIPPPRRNPPPDIGVIAGNRNRLISGIFLSRESDGRVEVKETILDGMADFAVLPFIHTKIHTRRETAALVDRFLREGRFRSFP